jgi:hypothetical protein
MVEPFNKTLPPLNKLSDVLKSFSVETFREIISPLFFRVDLQNDNISIVDVTPEEVPLDEKIFGSVGDSLLGGKEKSAVVVFEDTAPDRRLELRWKSERGDNLGEERTERKKRPHACA